MRTDITKINEQTPVGELTEGLMVFQSFLIQESGEQIHRYLKQIYANSVYSVHLSVRM